MPEPLKKRNGDKPASLSHARPPAARSPAGPLRRAPEAPAPGGAPKSRVLLFSLAGGGAGLLLILGLALGLSGGGKPPREEPPPARPVALTPKTEPKRSDAEPVPPNKDEVEAAMKRDIEARKKKFQEEQARKVETERTRAAEEREKREAEAKRSKELAEEEKKAASAGYEARKRERRAESVRHLEEARRTIEDDRKAEAARQKSLAERLKNLKLSIRLKNGLLLQNVVVQGMTREELKLAFTFEGASAEQSFPIEFVDDRSYVELLRAIHKDGGAAGLYEMGRHLVMRKLWKDAQAAFGECVKLDSGYSGRVPDISRILNNEAAFKGSARRIGANQLIIGYDFSDAAQAQDFTAQQPGQLAVEGGELKLTARGTALWTLKDVDFEGDLEIDLVATVEENSSLILGAFLNWERKGYLGVLNGKTPAGHILYRCGEAGKIEPLVVQKEPRLAPAAETRIRFTVRGGAFRVYVGDQEALAATDTTFGKGWFALGATNGVVRIRRMTVQGRVNPAEIDKRFAEVEILVRRALESDLGKKKKKDSDEDVDPLSAEDDYFMAALDPGVRADFEKARSTFVKALQKRRLLPTHLALFDPLVQRAPEFAPLYYWRGVARMSARKPEEARGDFETATRINPDFYEAFYAAAQARFEERELPLAAAAVKKALELAPGYADTVALGGFLKYLAGDAKGAVGDLEIARKLEPTNESVATTQKNILNVIKGPQHLGAKYQKEFPHFLVMTDMSPEKTLLYGGRLEAAYKFYSDTFKEVFTEDPKRPKPRVAVFNTREAYLTYGELTLSGRQEWTLGYFHPLYKELLLFEDVDPEATLQTLYHEAFHQFMSLMVARAPYWYNEGIAEYMGGIKIEVPKSGPSKILERARLLEGRLKVLKMMLPLALKFEDIMMESPAQFYSGPVSFKYSQAWSMVHFFYEYQRGKYRPRIDSYFRRLKDGGTPREAFDSGFGDARMEDLQKEWLDYVKKLEPPKK